MVELSLIEKIKTTINLIFSSSLFFILLLGIIIIIIDINFISKKSKKINIIYTIISIIAIIILLFKYLQELINIINIINKSIVTIINFPTMLEYITITLISIIIMIISLLSKKTNKLIKRINIGVIISDIFIFFLILDQISKNNIEISSQINIYSHQNLMVLFELCMIIFILWISGLIIYKICKTLINKPQDTPEKINIKEEPKEETIEEEIELPKRREDGTIISLYDEPEMPKTIEELRKINTNKLSKEELIDGVFTLEEYREINKLLRQLKNKE